MSNLQSILYEIKPCDLSSPYIFISYSSHDSELVWRDVREFQRRGYNVWLDEKNLDKTKTSWREDAIAAIEDMECELVVFYVSSTSLRSDACYQELSKTVDERTRAMHFGPVKFIAVDAEPVGDITAFAQKVFLDIRRSNLDKHERSRQALALNGFMRDFFNSNNEKVRIHPKHEANRKIDYYDDITASFPDITRVFEPEKEVWQEPAADTEREAKPEKKPEAEVKPKAEAEPVAEVRKAAEKKAGAEMEPAAEVRKAAEKKAGAEMEPATEVRKAAEKKAEAEMEPATEVRKAAERKAEPKVEPAVRSEKSGSEKELKPEKETRKMIPEEEENDTEEEKEKLRQEVGHLMAEVYRKRVDGEKESSGWKLSEKTENGNPGQEPRRNMNFDAAGEPATKTGGMPAVETDEMSDADVGGMPAAETDEMSAAVADEMSDVETDEMSETENDEMSDPESGFDEMTGEEAAWFTKPEGEDVRSWGYNIFGKREVRDTAIRKGVLEIPLGYTKILTKIIHSMYWGNGDIVELILPDSMQSLNSSEFRYCTRLKKVRLPKYLTEISCNAFQDCTSLQEIIIPGNVTEIKAWAFKDCTSLRKVVLPQGLRSIGMSAFEGCTSLKEVHLPLGLQTMDMGCFQGCTSLKEIRIPGSVKKVEIYAFEGCTSLRTVFLEEGVEEIESAFAKCGPGRMQVWVPDSVTAISTIAFSKSAPTFHCNKGSFAEIYAKNESYRCMTKKA